MSKTSKGHGKSGRSWRFLTLATVLFFIVAGIYYVIIPVQESKRHEQTLIERFGWADKYTPSIDGSIPPQRVEAFIRVREAVQTHCADYQGILDDIIGLESLETDQDMPAGEKASKGLDSFKSMFSAAPKMLAFMDARNTTLLAEEMGLGEYFYIYLAAYGEQLAGEPESRYSEMEDAYISPRTREEFVHILENQLTDLESAGPDTSHSGLIAELRGEIGALQDGSHPSPWPNGAGSMTRESLAPYRERLAELYCAGIVKIELLQKNRGLNLEG
jgi:hypothetical protein